MALFTSKSKDWLDTLETVNRLLKENPNRSGVSLAEELGISSGQASNFTTLNGCLDQAAIDKIRLAKPYNFSLNSALALAGLKKAKTGDLSTAVHTTLDIALARRLPTLQIKALVEWMLKGNPADTFETEKKDKSDKGAADADQSIPADEPNDFTAQVMQLAKTALEEKDRNDGSTTARDKLKALLEKTIAEAIKNADSGKGKKEKEKSKTETDEPSWFWKWMVGIKFFSQLKSKVKKGQSLTPTEKMIVVLYKIYKFFEPPFKHTVKFFGRLGGKAVKGIWESSTQWLGKTFADTMKWVIPLLIICAVIWGAGKVYQYVIVNPLHWLEHKVVSGFHWGEKSEEQPAPIATPQSVASEQMLANQPPMTHSSPRKVEKPVATVISYQPAVSFIPNPASPKTLYDPKILELEIASVPKNSIVKDFPLTPDEGMPLEVASSRMQDVNDPDKYTMFIGSGKEIITSVNAGNTTLTIYFKSADPLDFWGGKGPMNFLWEDVKYIHANEIDHSPGSETQQPEIIYQCSLVVSGAKYPLTIQCASAEDLEHLVSTLQYFIRHSRLGHDTALAGMPYPYQGLVMNNDRVVEKLWAGSPIDKAGVALGDHLWSTGNPAYYQQSRKDLEKSLSSSAVFYAASSADWDKALIASRIPGQSTGFHPKLRKVVLSL